MLRHHHSVRTFMLFLDLRISSADTFHSAVCVLAIIAAFCNIISTEPRTSPYATKGPLLPTAMHHGKPNIGTTAMSSTSTLTSLTATSPYLPTLPPTRKTTCGFRITSDTPVLPLPVDLNKPLPMLGERTTPSPTTTPLLRVKRSFSPLRNCCPGIISTNTAIEKLGVSAPQLPSRSLLRSHIDQPPTSNRIPRGPQPPQRLPLHSSAPTRNPSTRSTAHSRHPLPKLPEDLVPPIPPLPHFPVPQPLHAHDVTSKTGTTPRVQTGPSPPSRRSRRNTEDLYRTSLLRRASTNSLVPPPLQVRRRSVSASAGLNCHNVGAQETSACQPKGILKKANSEVALRGSVAGRKERGEGSKAGTEKVDGDEALLRVIDDAFFVDVEKGVDGRNGCENEERKSGHESPYLPEMARISRFNMGLRLDLIGCS